MWKKLNHYLDCRVLHVRMVAVLHKHIMQYSYTQLIRMYKYCCEFNAKVYCIVVENTCPYGSAWLDTDNCAL